MEEEEILSRILKLEDLDISPSNKGAKRTVVGIKIPINENYSISLNARDIKDRKKLNLVNALITDNIREKFSNANIDLGNLNLGYKGLSTSGNYNVEGKNFEESGKWENPYRKRINVNYTAPINENWLANFSAEQGDMGLSDRYMEGMDPFKDENYYGVNFRRRF